MGILKDLGCFCRLSEHDINIKNLRDLANNWIMNDENIEKAQILISNFSECVKEDGGKNRDRMKQLWQRDIDDYTCKRLVHIAKLCVVNTISKHLGLEHIKNVLRTLEGEDFDSVHYTFTDYIFNVGQLEDIDLIYFDSVEDLVKFDLGPDLYKRLTTIIHFFEKFRDFKQSVFQIS